MTDTAGVVPPSQVGSAPNEFRDGPSIQSRSTILSLRCGFLERRGRGRLFDEVQSLNVRDSRGRFLALLKAAPIVLLYAPLVIDLAPQGEIEDRGEILTSISSELLAPALCLRRKHLLQDVQYRSHGAWSQTAEAPR